MALSTHTCNGAEPSCTKRRAGLRLQARGARSSEGADSQSCSESRVLLRTTGILVLAESRARNTAITELIS